MFKLMDIMPALEVIAVAVNVLLVLVIMPLRAAISRLEVGDSALSDRIQHLELKLVENYVRRDEITRDLSEINRRLERFEGLVTAQIATTNQNTS